MKISPEDAIAACDAICARLDLGSVNPAATIEIYSGAAPTTLAEVVTTQVLLVKLAMNASGAFAGAIDGVNHAEATANAIADTPALADGTAAWFRIRDRDDAVRWQGTLSEPNLGGDLELSSLNIIAGVNVVTVSLKARMPKG